MRCTSTAPMPLRCQRCMATTATLAGRVHMIRMKFTIPITGAWQRSRGKWASHSTLSKGTPMAARATEGPRSSLHGQVHDVEDLLQGCGPADRPGTSSAACSMACIGESALCRSVWLAWCACGHAWAAAMAAGMAIDALAQAALARQLHDPASMQALCPCLCARGRRGPGLALHGGTCMSSCEHGMCSPACNMQMQSMLQQTVTWVVIVAQAGACRKA